jgi:hypothetical protein
MPIGHVHPDRGADLAAPDSAVEAEQTRLLLQNPIGVPATLINVCLVCVVVWPLYPAGLLALWLALFVVVSLHRLLLNRRYAGATGSEKTSPRWARVFTLHTFTTGCLWGLSASVMLITPDPIYHNFIVFVLGGMMAEHCLLRRQSAGNARLYAADYFARHRGLGGIRRSYSD